MGIDGDIDGNFVSASGAQDAASCVYFQRCETKCCISAVTVTGKYSRTCCYIAIAGLVNQQSIDEDTGSGNRRQYTATNNIWNGQAVKERRGSVRLPYTS